MTPPAIAAHLELWDETRGGAARLLNLSENHGFRIDVPGGKSFFLRVHRPGYQSAASIVSELDWLRALRTETGVPVPTPLPGRDGRLLQTLPQAGGADRHAVLFAFVPGTEPQPGDGLGGLFTTLGRFAALLHIHAIGFRPPPAFVRPTWNAASILDRGGLWGDWRAAPGVTGSVAETLRHLDTRLRANLAAYGTGRERFGLIHADMRLANLLVDGDRVTLIDFDDCGFGWFMYDFAAALSFHEATPEAPLLRRRWLDGYRAVRPLAAADLASIDAMVLLRRMALLAWIGSHHETDLAHAHAPDFAAVTARLAVPYLVRGQSLEHFSF